MAWLSVKDFAEQTGLSVAWVHVLINDKQSGLETMRPGHEYLIDEDCVPLFRRKKRTERPSRQGAAKSIAKKNGRIKGRPQTIRTERASQ